MSAKFSLNYFHLSVTKNSCVRIGFIRILLLNTTSLAVFICFASFRLLDTGWNEAEVGVMVALASKCHIECFKRIPEFLFNCQVM